MLNRIGVGGLVLVIAALTALAVGLVGRSAGKSAGRAAAGAVERASVRNDLGTCNAGNLVRADRFIDSKDPDDSADERKRVNALFGIRDCDIFSRTGEVVRLDTGQEHRFIAVVTERRIPMVSRGKVVGSMPPPKVRVSRFRQLHPMD